MACTIEQWKAIAKIEDAILPSLVNYVPLKGGIPGDNELDHNLNAICTPLFNVMTKDAQEIT